LGHNRDIKEALKSDDRELAIESLSGLSASYADNTNLKNVKIHIHTKDVKSFLRNWNLDKYGDRLDTFRYTINRVKNSKRPLVAIEVGKAGLSIRGISPVIDNGEYLGSVEFMQGFNSVVKDMKSNDISLLVLMGDTHSKLLFKQKDKLKNLTISQKEYDKDFKEALSSINFQRLREENYLIVKNYFVACVPIMDYEDNQVGVYIMGQDLKHINTEISGAKDLIDTSIMLIISALITFGLVFYVARKK
jgi:methyl-accepting chemotaxis protein